MARCVASVVVRVGTPVACAAQCRARAAVANMCRDSCDQCVRTPLAPAARCASVLCVLFHSCDRSRRVTCVPHGDCGRSRSARRVLLFICARPDSVAFVVHAARIGDPDCHRLFPHLIFCFAACCGGRVQSRLSSPPSSARPSCPSPVSLCVPRAPLACPSSCVRSPSTRTSNSSVQPCESVVGVTAVGLHGTSAVSCWVRWCASSWWQWWRCSVRCCQRWSACAGLVLCGPRLCGWLWA